MPAFDYRAKTQEGETKTGRIEAADPFSVAQILREHEFLPIYIKPVSSLVSFSPASFLSRVSGKERAQLTRMLATMLETGLPLVDALENLENQTSNPKLQTVLKKILEDVSAGLPLSQAMTKFPETFPELYVNMVKAGEASGQVDESLNRLAQALEKTEEFRGKVRGALIYPAIVVSAMLGIGFLMLTMVIPKIAGVYKEFGAELPLPTRILIVLSELFSGYWFLLPLVLLLSFFFLRLASQNPATAYLLSEAKFRLPVFGKINREVTLAIMTRTLGSLVASGIGIIEALRLVSQTVGNNPYRPSLQTIVQQVEKGFPLSVALAADRRFPQIISQMIAIGEETGTIDDSLFRLASFFEATTEEKVKTLTTALEPVLILLMGLGVAGLAVAILLPMFNLVNVIR